MKSIGSLLFIFGVAAIIFGFMDRVPSLLEWIYEWGEGPAWAIKIGFVVVGGILYMMGRKQKSQEESTGQQ
ncbi:MAG TPA: hypothetical protein VIZ28_08220 [Chitinophagaceae bacterium]